MKTEWPTEPDDQSVIRGQDLAACSRVELFTELTQFMLAYGACIDEDRLEQWPAYFTDDGVYEMVSRENADRGLPATAMHCRGVGMMRDRVVSLRHANIFAKQYYRHLLSDLRIIEQDGPQLRVSGNYLVTRTLASEGDPIVFSVGRTDDLLLFGEQGLRLKRRRVISDNDRIHTLLVLPI